jgi:hypothetical protein
MGRSHDCGHGEVNERLAGGIGVPKPKPSVLVRREQQAARAAAIRAVRAAVWRRDGGRCRACNGRRRGRHLHHLRYRSCGGPWTTTNCLVVCAECHQDLHAGLLVATGVNANTPGGVRFERRRWR